MHKVSLEQWRAFIAVVDYGGFAQAGDALYKTQSTISHSIKKLEKTVGNPLFDVIGRKAVVTQFGESLLPAARSLITHADNLEHEAISQKIEVRKSLNIAVDTLFPRAILAVILNELTLEFPNLNIQLYETVLSRCAELLEDGTVDFGIASTIPKGYITKWTHIVEMHATTHKAHPLASREHIKLSELKNFRQVVIRDAGLRSNVNSGWLGTTNRLTVSSAMEAATCVKNQLGFAWLPDWLINETANIDELVPLKLESGVTRSVVLQLTFRLSLTDDPVMQKLSGLFDKYCGNTHT
ncbi:transcriptional regulator, LysR family protein [Catenovulum agarivorans DS-2]|uniref:Transcriptional regulator, LysR family protein n=1 Tax=Catenovulum agarivorans DS-2 TaxID=1328313 RepID=W7QMS0_9ALTE|nr:LysR family transcriptional regulator [Catenovulum agarivorans]EWH10242.1 transcriptional regulator, LysR family protein [Catenovulum agarivorans DS-2]